MDEPAKNIPKTNCRADLILRSPARFTGGLCGKANGGGIQRERPGKYIHAPGE